MKFRAAFILLFIMAIFAVPAQAAPTALGSGLIPVEPVSCPAGGCAPGQRLSYRLEFEVGTYDTQLSPNVKVCVYIPSSWLDSTTGSWLDSPTIQLDAAGGITGVAYAKAALCPEDPLPPAGYALVAAGAAALNQNYFNDSLNLSFRISAAGSGQGSILMRVFEQSADSTWQRSSQIFTSQLQLAARAASVYVAADPAACSNNPCYLDSAGDLANGLGTGLKDAVDALDPAQPDLKLAVLGTVALKSNPVVIQRAVSLLGGSDSILTTDANSACNPANPLIMMTAGGSVQNLTINDGACSGANDRPLIQVNSPAPVLIEANNLGGGSDAIQISGNTGNVTVRYNQITTNSGYALIWKDPANTPSGALLDLTANNLYQNRSGDQVECAAGAPAANPSRRADHNYWGSASAPNPAANHCTLTAGRQLGAPVQTRPSGSGLDVVKVTVGTTKTYAFNKQIAFNRGADGADFDLYIVNHGSVSPDGIPFVGTFAIPNPCSNAWDAFLAEGAAPGSPLSLYVSYNRSPACLSAVEMSTFCAQTTSPQNYPLWWYDPRGGVTGGWDTTGQKPAGPNAGGVEGQATSCDRTAHEIKVDIDSTGRPNLAEDMKFLPLLVGIPATSSFIALASNQTVTLQWTTVSEPDLSGFIVMRSLAAGGPFDPITDLIARKGYATGGSSYSYVDSGRTNGTALYYRLKVVRTDGNSIYSDVVSIVPNIATATLTPTATQTFTPTLTRTPFPTFTPYRFPTTAAPLPTRVPSVTQTRFASPTSARTGTATFPAGTSSVTLTPGPGTVYPTNAYPPPNGTSVSPGSGTPSDTTLTAAATLAGENPGTPGVSSTPTITSTASRTPAPTLSRGEQIRGASKYISMLMGVLLGGGIIFALAWVFFLRKKP